MADIKLTVPGHDLDLSTGDLQLETGQNAIAQHLRIRLRAFRGEWTLDPEIGIPYFERVLIKNPDDVVLNSIYRQAIVSTPGVLGIDKLTLDLNTANRAMSMSFAAKTEGDDAVLNFTDRFVVI